MARHSWSAHKIVEAIGITVMGIGVVGPVRAATTNNPLIGNGVNPVIYYYDYSNDGTTGTQIVNDRTNNTTDGTALLDPNEFYISNGLIVETSAGSGQYVTGGDDLFTSLIDGNSQGDGIGGAPTADFVYADPVEDFLLPGARALDVAARTEGAFTGTQNILGNAMLAGAGGYTFETYIKRTANDIARPQIVWSPEGTHSIEIIPYDATRSALQIAFRQEGRALFDVDQLLPLDEWHHIMAVMDITTSPNANYSFYVDGVLVAPDLNDPLSTPPAPGNNPIGGAAGLPINRPGNLTLDTSPNREHGLGSQEFGSPPGDPRHFLGQLAMTRLSLGALTLEQSLFDFGAEEDDADFDGDGDVDGADFLTWQRGVGTNVGAQFGNGDANRDGAINGLDLDIWKGMFGASSVAASPVPEPSAVALTIAWAMFFAARRRV